MKACAECGDLFAQNSVAQKYCMGCRKVVRGRQTRDWKRAKRAKDRAARKTKHINCEVCGVQVEQTSPARRFCKPCRKEHDLIRSRAKTKKWRAENPQHRIAAAAAQRQRRKENPKYAISARISVAMYQCLNGKKGGVSWQDLVGYRLDELISHLERQFAAGMTWDNYGEWHVDHIRPVSSFEFDSPEHPHFRECWALNNLRPLWAKDNLIKGGKVIHLV